jgi:hypothetical protein
MLCQRDGSSLVSLCVPGPVCSTSSHRVAGEHGKRNSFATWALDAGLSIFDLSRYMGTSVEMIDRTYGHLAQGAEESARAKRDAAYARRLGQDRATSGTGEEE